MSRDNQREGHATRATDSRFRKNDPLFADFPLGVVIKADADSRPGFTARELGDPRHCSSVSGDCLFYEEEV